MLDDPGLRRCESRHRRRIGQQVGERAAARRWRSRPPAWRRPAPPATGRNRRSRRRARRRGGAPAIAPSGGPLPPPPPAPPVRSPSPAAWSGGSAPPPRPRTAGRSGARRGAGGCAPTGWTARAAAKGRARRRASPGWRRAGRRPGWPGWRWPPPGPAAALRRRGRGRHRPRFRHRPPPPHVRVAPHFGGNLRATWRSTVPNSDRGTANPARLRSRAERPDHDAHHRAGGRRPQHPDLRFHDAGAGGLPGPHLHRWRERPAGAAVAPGGPGRARHQDAAHGRDGAAAAAAPAQRHAGDLPHLQGRGGGRADGPPPRRRRLHHQALQPAPAAGAHPRPAAPQRGRPRGGQRHAGGRRHRPRRPGAGRDQAHLHLEGPATSSSP